MLHTCGFTQRVYIRHLLCRRHCPGHWLNTILATWPLLSRRVPFGPEPRSCSLSSPLPPFFSVFSRSGQLKILWGRGCFLTGLWPDWHSWDFWGTFAIIQLAYEVVLPRLSHQASSKACLCLSFSPISLPTPSCLLIRCSLHLLNSYPLPFSLPSSELALESFWRAGARVCSFNPNSVPLKQSYRRLRLVLWGFLTCQSPQPLLRDV